MGRTQRSQGLAPPAVRKDLRAKQARHIVNKVIPALLASNARARKGSENSELIVDPPAVLLRTQGTDHQDKNAADEAPQYIKRKGQGRRKAKNEPNNDAEDKPTESLHIVRRNKKTHKKTASIEEATSQLSIDPPSQPHSINIRIISTDSLTATKLITPPPLKPSKKPSNPCILNMASPLRPGGGVLTGATSQEEFLCARTTLLPSLNESFYRLPEFGGVYTRDVLVFRSSRPLADAGGELGPTDRYFVDVVSAGMLRFPELEGEDDAPKRLAKKDRLVVEKKMRAVLRIACSHGVKKLVLGAWGCGAYGNPIRDIAEAWATVLRSSSARNKNGKMSGPRESWDTIDEIIFAIENRKMAEEFARAFGGDVVVEVGPGGRADDEDDEEEDDVAEELRGKIKEMEGQVGSVWNPELKIRMGAILEGLRAQLREREGEGAGAEDDEEYGEDVAGEEDEEVEVSDEEDESDPEDSDDASEDGGLNLH
jgi:uncharacterized protein (TIGR02452 family)